MQPVQRKTPVTKHAQIVAIAINNSSAICDLRVIVRPIREPATERPVATTWPPGYLGELSVNSFENGVDLSE